MLRVNVTCSYNIVVEEHELEEDARYSESGNPYSDSYWEGSQESDVPEDDLDEEEEEQEDWDNHSDAESVHTEDESHHDGDSAESDYDYSMSIVPYGADPRRTRRDVHRRIHRSYRWRRSTGSAEGGAEQRSAPAAASSHAASGGEGGEGSARGAAHGASSTRRPHRRISHANNSNCIQGEVVLGQPTVMYRTQPSQLSGPAAAAASAAAAAVAAASGPSQRIVVQAAARAAAAAAANSVAEQMEQHNAAPWPTTTTSSTSSAPPRPDRADLPRRASQTSLGSSAGEEWPTRGASREEAEVYQPYSSLYSQHYHHHHHHPPPPPPQQEEEEEEYEDEEDSLLGELGRQMHSRLLPNTSTASAVEALSSALADYPRYDHTYGRGGGGGGARYGASALRGQYLSAERDWESAYRPRSHLGAEGGEGGKYGSATDAVARASEEAILARLRLAEAMRQQMTLPEDIVQAGSGAATTAVAAGGGKCLFARRSHERIALPPSRPVSAVSDHRRSALGHRKGASSVGGQLNVALLSAGAGAGGAGQVPLDTPDMLEMRDGAEVLVVLDPAEPLTPDADTEPRPPGSSSPTHSPSPSPSHAALFAPRARNARKADAPSSAAGKQLASQRSRIEPKRGGAAMCDARRSGGSLSNVLRVEPRGREGSGSGAGGVGGGGGEMAAGMPSAINPRLRRSQPLAPTQQPLSNHHRRLGLSISGHRSGGPPAATATATAGGGSVTLPLLRH